MITDKIIRRYFAEPAESATKSRYSTKPGLPQIQVIRQSPDIMHFMYFELILQSPVS